MTRWCHWWHILSHPIQSQRKENEPWRNAAQIIDGLNAIKLRAKSHLFHESMQGWVWKLVNLKAFILAYNLPHCQKQYDITESKNPKIWSTSFLSPWKKLTTKQRRYKVWIKIRLKFDLNCFDSFLMDSNLKSFSIRLLLVFLSRENKRKKHSN